MNFSNLNKTALTIALTVGVLSACGGGGDATSPAETTTTPPATTGGTPTPTPEPTPAPTPTSRFDYVPNGSGGNYGLNCVKDNTTGLIWEGKNPANSSLHFVGRTYTHFDSTTALQKRVGASAPVAPTLAEVNAASNSIGLQNATNAEALCGFTNWRMPTVAELSSLQDTTVSAVSGGPAINVTWFAFTLEKNYWASDAWSFADGGWVVGFQSGGGVGGNGRSSAISQGVRLVRN